MRNLELLDVKVVQSDILKNVSNLCVTSGYEGIYFADGCRVISSTEINNESFSDKTRSKHEIPEDAFSCEVIQMDFIVETQSLCLSNSKGDIMVYDPVLSEIEVVGSVSSGLHSVAWSPDQEFLVLMTGQNTFILMTKEFDAIVEKDLHVSEFGENNPISVGWGSKETQFQGSAGKDAAKIKKAVPKSAQPWDDGKHRISWRGDGQCFVTSVIDLELGYRKLRIWSREAVLQCTNEITDGLEHTLCWKPSGNLITCSQQSANKHEVIFFEKNGLQHGGFTLPFKPNTFVIREILWNTDSTVLALWGYEQTESALKNFNVMLWTMNNYHWYLKQTLNFDDVKVKGVFWDQNQAYNLHVLCTGGYYYHYSLGWAVNHSFGNKENDAVVAVIDGDDILVTPFGKMKVPPPMSAYSFKLPVPVNEISFTHAETETLSEFMAILSDGRLAFFKQGVDNGVSNDSENCKLHLKIDTNSGFKMQMKPLCFSGLYNFTMEDGFTTNRNKYVLPYHWTLLEKNTLLCVMPKENSVECDLLSLILPETLEKSNTLTLKKVSTMDDKIIRICAREDGTACAVILKNGKVFKYENNNLEEWISNSKNILCIQHPCLAVALWTVHDQEVLFSLSERFQLYYNEKVLVSRCTSFQIHDEFLLITTCDNDLQCYFKKDMTDSENDLPLQTANQASQRVEKGSRIVRTVPGRTDVILQTPRGNLEVLHPRLLVLTLICRLLDSLKFDEAFTLMKKHRIDMNLMYDHNPKKFLSCIDTVIDQLGSCTEINLFLASLMNEDVASSMYQVVYHVTPRPAPSVTNLNKINIICNAMRMGIEKKKDDKLFQAYVSCYAKKCPPELDQALLKIKEMKDRPHTEGENSSNTADAALKLLLYLVDASELYNEALGTYDFEITIMVAEKSQKDPKQYIPFLNELKSLEENYQKFKIDMHLHRYKKALLHIVHCDDRFDECIDLIKNQRLYKDALYLFPSSSVHYKTVWESYGDYLVEKKYYGDSGLAFTKSGHFEKALTSYCGSLDWQSWICVLKKLNYPALQNTMLCRDMAAKLKQNQKYMDAAVLLESYVEDIEESIITLIEGHEWDSALRLMMKYDRTDIIETHMKLALNEQYESLNTSLEQMASDFNTHNARLKTVRIEKKKAAFLCDEHANQHNDDLFSDTSSVSNLSSLSGTVKSGKQLSGSLITAKTGRSRRKQELKKYRLKEGSPNEDLAHMAALSDIITKMDKMKENFCNTLKTLVKFDMDTKAQNLQEKMGSICKTIESEIPNIWQPDQTLPSFASYGPTSTSNSIVADMYGKTNNSQHKESEVPKPRWHSDIPLGLTFLQ